MSKTTNLADVFAAFDKAEAKRLAFPAKWEGFRDSLLRDALDSAHRAYKAKFGEDSVSLGDDSRGDTAGGRRIIFTKPVRFDIAFAPRSAKAKVSVQTLESTESGQEWLVVELVRISDLTAERIESQIATLIRQKFLSAGVIYDD